MSRRLLSPDELQAGLPLAWVAQGHCITRTYPSEHYRGGVAFALRVAQDAEAHDHHPELTLRSGSVTVTYWTHDRGGVTAYDLKAAARADALYGANE